MKRIIALRTFADFVRKILNLIKLDIIVILLVKIEGQLITNVLLMSQRKKVFFIPVVSHIFINYDCHLVFRRLVDKKNDKVKFDIVFQVNEEYIPVLYSCFRFIDNYRLLSGSLDSLVRTLD